jgi:putative endonuclease
MANGSENNIGKTGEIIAANYLKGKGYRIDAANFSNEIGYRIGELDIVARDPESDEIVFIEVKTRRASANRSLDPESAIDRSKYRKLVRIIGSYLRRNKLEDCDYRLDAISIELNINRRKANLRHLKYIYY